MSETSVRYSKRFSLVELGANRYEIRWIQNKVGSLREADGVWEAHLTDELLGCAGPDGFTPTKRIFETRVDALNWLGNPSLKWKDRVPKKPAARKAQADRSSVETAPRTSASIDAAD